VRFVTVHQLTNLAVSDNNVNSNQLHAIHKTSVQNQGYLVASNKKRDIKNSKCEKN